MTPMSPASLANSPFIVGVSGHRDLDAAELPRLREAVTDFVRQLKAHLPDTQLRMLVGMAAGADLLVAETALALGVDVEALDRKSTRLNSSHVEISYAVFCL